MFDTIVKYVVGEIGVIAQAPVAFALCLGVIVILVWTAFKWRYGATVEHFSSRLALRDDQINDYKQKLSGASADEVKNRMELLELQVKMLSPRRLSDKQKDSILPIIKSTTSIIEITTDAASGDAKALAFDYEVTFRAANWQILSSTILGHNFETPSGLVLQVANLSSLREPEFLAKRALEAAGISFEMSAGLRPPQPSMPEAPGGVTAFPNPINPSVGIFITTPLMRAPR